MIKLLKTIVPPSIKRKLVELVEAAQSEGRRDSDQRIPKIKLARKHMQNCKLLLDRQELLQELPRCGVAAELGVAAGEFSEQILRICDPAKLHLIDIWESERYHEELYNGIVDKFRNQITAGTVQIHRQPSVDAGDNFDDGYFDWIYIDTTHSYRMTRAELLKYESKVKPDGMIAGHDYAPCDWVRGNKFGVVEAVHEFCVTRNWELRYITMEPTEFQSFAIRRIRDE